MMSAAAKLAKLELLPSKTSLPLQRLLTQGLLDEETVAVILDAGELDKKMSGTPHKLLGFAVAFLYLESKQIPVRDTIRMAREHRRRLDLDWSPKRWKQEHDRLSKVAVLARLSGENVVYELSKYDAVLPSSIQGYLIRSSRRLGMEGLRQRHCVAGYHNRVSAGYCAIASLFIDQQRWTVELALTGNPDSPLRIDQIKTRFNQPATGDIRTRIHQVLGIKQVEKSHSAIEPVAHEYTYLENLRRVLPLLRDHDVSEVRVEFDGGGDSGSIQAVHYDVDSFDDSGIYLEVAEVQSEFNQVERRWINTRIESHQTLGKAIEELTYDYLSESDVDWYNNDGGFGELVIKVDEGTVSLEVSTRYTESSLEFDQTLEIETGDVI